MSDEFKTISNSSLITSALIIAFMLPEIARRCESCGAAIRVHAVFCPQCGVPLRREGQTGEGQSSVASESKSQEMGDQLKTKNIMAQTIDTGQVSEANAPEPVAEAVPAAAAQTEVSAREAGDVASVETGSDTGTEKRRRRVTAAARERVQENLRPRVEKLRQTSAVVLDEASEDPSLRFVLVAALLIIISLIILLISLLR